MDLRIGHGYDIHRIVPGRPLVLGGVRFDTDYGLDGHSDADCATHAVCDALLGAAGLGVAAGPAWASQDLAGAGQTPARRSGPPRPNEFVFARLRHLARRALHAHRLPAQPGGDHLGHWC